MSSKFFQLLSLLLYSSMVFGAASILQHVGAEPTDFLVQRSTFGSIAANTSTCRCFPGDACWPTEAAWTEFNNTLGGKLIATKPIASVCHVDSFAPFNANECADLQANWDFPETHFPTTSSVMAPFFANQSCDPFAPKDSHCILGNLIQYAVNATEASDYQKTIEFTQKNNIRLVIRNTGHDYLGKSTGAGALGIWTHHSKSIEFMNYKSSLYTGKAVKLGAGVQVSEMNEAANAAGLVVVGGNCQSVGVAGGFTQGGGHGALSSKFGLAADQVLEWEVVTGTGELLKASPSENPDLYWALSGGGGGTYGIVLSMTSKAHPDLATSAANLTFTSAGISQDTFYGLVETFISIIPAVVDSGAVNIWLLTNEIFMMMPTTAPGVTAAELNDIFTPMISKLKAENISYTYFVEDFPTYLACFQAMTPEANVTEYQLGGRLIPRSVVESKTSELVTALRFINDNGAIVSGVSANVAKKPEDVPNAVNPAWRDAVIDVVLGTPWNFQDWDLNLANQGLMTNILMPQLENLTPGGGAYLNEANFQQPDFQFAFYGKNYDALAAIKDKYDPNHLFYARTAVGSEYWTEQADGRLCLSES